MGSVYHDISELSESTARVISVGNFDGFHAGHRALINGLIETSKRLDAEPLLVTFRPHPRYVINPETAPQLILTPEEELETLTDRFDGDILLMTFDEKVRNLSAEQFVKDILIDRLGLKALVSGENNTIGKDRIGNRDKLNELAEELGFEFVVIKPVTIDGNVLSSTAIRKYIADGELERANGLLETPYRISGEVIRGIGLGRKLGYPTANLEFNQFKALPKEGVYAAHVVVDQTVYGAMMFIGKNHMHPDESFSVEANILDFDREIYGEIIEFLPQKFVRPNLAITSEEELIELIRKDKIIIENILKKKESSSVR